MKPGPNSAKAIFFNFISIDAAPKSAEDWLVDICLSEGWYASDADAREAAERWRNKFLSLLRSELSALQQIGRFAPFNFNSSSDYLIQGYCFIEPRDPEELKEAKRRRSMHVAYVSCLRSLTPREFEALCVGLLSLLGVDDPKLTPYSSDQGIDFWGRLRLERLMTPANLFPGIQRQMSIWMIGQAKHYKKSDVSTFSIRELVGSVELARGRAFSSSLDGGMWNLDIRVCDPIFYLFFTTGRITSDSWELIKKSGVAAMDGDMVAALLADRSVGVEGGHFSPDNLSRWIGKFMPDK